MYDIIVVGAGPAGISAAIYAVSRGKKTLVIEKEQVGGILGKVSRVTHYTGLIPDETGETIAARMKAQAESAGVVITYENVIDVKLSGTVKKIRTDKNSYEAVKVILANGSTPKKLGIEGEDELAGKGIGMNAPRHAARYIGRNIYVVGGADGAVKEAIYLARFARKLTVIHFEDRLAAVPEFMQQIEKLPNVEILTQSRLTKVSGVEQVEALEITNEADNTVTRIEDSGCGIFVYAGASPNTELYEELSMEDGYILVNDRMETKIPGVYAAGDIRVKQIRQAATAVADGAIAGINAAM